MFELKWHLLSGILVCALGPSAYAAETTLSCRDEAGAPVDWFYAYKLPKKYRTEAHRDDETTGLRYMYITSNNYDEWQMSGRDISAPDSITALTLQPIFDDATKLLLAYNDEYPNGTTVFTGGHAKGVVASDATTGIWLIHSVPKFPTVPLYEYPSTGELYGQSMLCLTLPAAEMAQVGTQLMFNEPNIYYKRLPVMLNGHFPQLERVMLGERVASAPFQNALAVRTVNGSVFKVFAKSSHYGGDLYEDFVAPALDVNLLVESWRNGAGNMPSNCSKSDNVYNVAEISAPALAINFRTTHDHSKWAVAQSTGLKFWRWRLAGTSWICIGDINRQQHQTQRGGGTVCQRHTKVAKLYRNLIAAYDPCQR